MGIPSYFSHVVKKHRDVIKKLTPDMEFDNLYLDSNGIIYDAVHRHPFSNNKEEYERMVIDAVCEKINNYIDTIRPRKRVIVAFDGVAPVAKLNQQRERRYKAWLQKHVVDGGSMSWDTCAITPGTAFMRSLSEEVKAYFSDSQFVGRHIVVTASDEEGEGEHKIYGAIRSEPDYHSATTTAIYGLDADLIMLTLNHLEIAQRIFLYRETPHFIKSIDSTLEPDCSYVVDVPHFAECLGKELTGTTRQDIGHAELVRDYVFMCFLLGNDFLPHFPSLNIRTNGIDKLLTVYRKCCASGGKFRLVSDKESKINWRCLRQLVTMLAASEHDSFVEEHDIRRKRSRAPNRLREGEDPNESRLMNIPIKERACESFIDPNEDGWEWRYYKCLFDTEVDNERRKEICVNYLEGLEWTMAYYTTGCKSWVWSYAYHYPPLLCDLAKYVPFFDTTFVEQDRSCAVSPFVQLSYVLPRAHLGLLPDDLSDILVRERPHWYQDRVRLIWSYCRYFWESHVELPLIDISELGRLVARVSRNGST
jgi:5'-3' exonuclease